MARNIVLLSDGTGNSAAKLFKTNVWRVYQALDVSNANQVACYDNGVGTSAFKPLAILGGAFGWGLKRNILAMYMFLCCHYTHTPGNPDRIFGFGFSRGAFTIRVLAKFVLSEGLVKDYGSTGELQRKSRELYRAFRKREKETFRKKEKEAFRKKEKETFRKKEKETFRKKEKETTGFRFSELIRSTFDCLFSHKTANRAHQETTHHQHRIFGTMGYCRRLRHANRGVQDWY